MRCRGEILSFLLVVTFMLTLLCLHWVYVQPYGLHFREQCQMFLCDIDYLVAAFEYPGGMADYIGEYVIQFFYLPILGGVAMSVLLTLVMLSYFFLGQLLKMSIVYRSVLALFMTLLSWMVMCDVDIMLSVPIAIVASVVLFAVMIWTARYCYVRCVVWFIEITVFYWLFGPIVFVAVAAFLILSLLDTEYSVRMSKLSLAVMFLLSLLLPIISQYICSYPLSSLFCGVHYYREPEAMPMLLKLVYVCGIMVLFVMVVLKSQRQQKVSTCIFLSLSLLLVVLNYCENVDYEKEEIFAYDYFVREGQWEEILHYADKREPETKMAMACVNFALANKGMLMDRYFNYSKSNDVELLVPSFRKNYIEPLYAGEINYALGYVNNAQRYAFEAQAAMPDGRHSSRCFKRLAETNIINGNFVVAKKYLHSLCKTRYYSEWAEKMLSAMSENRVDNLPWVKQKREIRPTIVYLTGFVSVVEQLMFSVKENPTNAFAKEYLKCLLMLDKQISTFVTLLDTELSPMEQQIALYYHIVECGGSVESMPYKISPMCVNRFARFTNDVAKYGIGDGGNFKSYSETYWYHHIFTK